ncbi:MAG TPA: hypothetical protein VFG23_19545 [Polyangia bacterium]|nr:hypothetical protein [Polyangia bacterium]
MNPEYVQRFARQIALPQIGLDGQTRICAARVLVVGGDRAAETAAQYLEAAGVGLVVHKSTPPTDGAGWLAALAVFEVVVRSGFDDDAMLGAAAQLGLPVVVVRATGGLVDLISFPRRDPAPTATLEIQPRPSMPAANGAEAILAGTLAAAETLTLLARSREANGIPTGTSPRHLRLPLDGGAPLAQQIGAP